MRKFLSVFLAMLVALSAAALAACGGTEDTPAEAEFQGIAFADGTFTYDGTEHAVTVQGDIPAGTDIKYENNARTDAGTNTAKATLTKEGYKTLELTATLTVNKAQFPSSVVLEGKRVLHDGKEHSLAVEGELPAGTAVSYDGNGQSAAGTYTVTATLTNPNYETKVLTATLEIYTLAQAAQDVLEGILDRPEPWQFLPEAFAPEAMAYGQMPVGGDDFTTDTDVSSIGKKAIGKQLNVLYDGLAAADTALSAADAVFTATEAVTAAYQKFLDENPDGTDMFEGSVTIGGAEFRLRIETEGERVTLLAGNGAVSVKLVSDRSSNALYRNEGRIQVTDGVALKYQSSETALKLAVRFTAAGVGTVQQISFTRSEDGVRGTLHEFYGTESANIHTSALLYSDGEVTAVLSDKRESNDMKIGAFAEVYDSRTGEMLGGEVTETKSTAGLTAAEYDTLWFNVYDVEGIKSVRAAEDTEEDDNTQNDHLVYINGKADTFLPEYNTVPIVGTKTSRHYDIEMRQVWYYVAVTDGDGTVYEKQETTVPMLFVQKENADDFAEECSENNGIAAALPQNDLATVTGLFTAHGAEYAEEKDNVTFADIGAYIGENDPFFAQK